MRNRLLVLHRWLGLTAGVLFSIAAGTGGALVYVDELDTLVRGPRFQTTDGLIGPLEIQSSVQRHAPGSRLMHVKWPTDGANILVVRVMHGQQQRDLVLDAGSGAVLRVRPLYPPLEGIRRLHINLFMGPIGGAIVQFASALALVSLTVGLVLWWPGLRRLPAAFRVRLRRGAYVSNLDLHQTLGALALPILLVMTLTGLLMNAAAMRLVSRLVHGSEPTTAWAALRSSPAATSSVIDLAAAIRAAAAEDPTVTITHVTFPASPDGIVEVGMLRSPEGAGAAVLRVALDSHTGTVLLRQQLRYEWQINRRLHFGLSGGPVVRALYALSCAVGFALLPTGVAVWWLRPRRHNSRTRRSA